MIQGNTGWNQEKEADVSTAKIAITLEESLLAEIDRLVRRSIFPNRSRAIQEAVSEKLKRLSEKRLDRECGKLDPSFEKSLAEEGMSGEASSWPEY
jgi:Arc/MetJ-type ribon-helix-helix transcriptional regulator